jgi:hypothetical protein
MSRIEDLVCEKIQGRAELGLKKYGVTVDRNDFTFFEWLQYLQEELMDATVYLQKIMEEIKKES